MAGRFRRTEGEIGVEIHSVLHRGAAALIRLKIGTDLEDVAGNSVARPFEVDATGPVTWRIASESAVSCRFESIRRPGSRSCSRESPGAPWSPSRTSKFAGRS